MWTVYVVAFSLKLFLLIIAIVEEMSESIYVYKSVFLDILIAAVDKVSEYIYV